MDELPASECHIWLALAPELLPTALVEEYEALITSEERVRYQSYRFERHRHLYLLTRALVRLSLSRYAPVAPERWRFATGSHGKPFLAEPSLPFSLSFNLANTEGMVACAVAREVALGVDVENVERLEDPLSIAHHFFSARETNDLRVLPAERQRERFFAYWTLKESYIKARGLGLAIPLDQFAFLLDQSGKVGLLLDDRLGDDARAWQCVRLDIAPPHALALSIRRGNGPDFSIRVRYTPLS